jgi:hypothetical protein
MFWKSIAVPLAVIALGVAMIILVLTAPDRLPNTGAGGRNVASQEDEPCSSYPSDELPERCLTPQPTDASAYPDQATATMGSATPVTTTTTVTATTTTTTTAVTPDTTSPTVATVRPAAPAAPATPARSPTVDSAEEAGPLASTPTPSNTLVCTPGERVLITGQGPPRAAFLLYFGQRVVGGGSVSITGSFSIPLVVGRERPGTYPVMVRVRGSEQVLRELTCEVPPAASPTPIRGALG